MCVDPVTGALIASTAITAAGAGVSAIQKNQTAQTNAAALQASADQREQKGAFDMLQADETYRRQAGSVEAKIGTTGVSDGSFSNVLADDAKESALQKKAIATGADVESNNLRFQAGGQLVAGQDALIGGAFSAAGAVAKGFGQYQQIGALQAKGAISQGGVAISDPFD